MFPNRRHAVTAVDVELELFAAGVELDEARARRDRAVAAALEAGMSAREVGRRVGLSHAGVGKIARRMLELGYDVGQPRRVDVDDTCVLCDEGDAEHEH